MSNLQLLTAAAEPAEIAARISHMTEDEKRIIRRQRVLKSGKIIFANGNSVVDCVIRNLSVAGARVEVPTTVWLPQEFTLLDAHSGRTYAAKVVWRRGDSMGVEFSDIPESNENDAS